MPDQSPIQLPHGSFALQSNNSTLGPDGRPTLYVTCSCGRGYAFGHYAGSDRLAAWLLDHDADIPCPHRTAMQWDGKCHDCGQGVASDA